MGSQVPGRISLTPCSGPSSSQLPVYCCDPVPSPSQPQPAPALPHKHRLTLGPTHTAGDSTLRAQQMGGELFRRREQHGPWGQQPSVSGAPRERRGGMRE